MPGHSSMVRPTCRPGFATRPLGQTEDREMRAEYNVIDFDRALNRSRAAVYAALEASIICELRRLLKDGQVALANSIAVKFITGSPKNRVQDRAIALLKLAREPHETTDFDRGSPGDPLPGESLQGWHERA